MERVYYLVLMAAPVVWSWLRRRPVLGPVAGLLVPFFVAILLQLLFVPDFVLHVEGMGLLLVFMACFCVGYELTTSPCSFDESALDKVVIGVRPERLRYAQTLAWGGCVTAVLFLVLSLYYVRILKYGVLDGGVFFREDYLELAEAGKSGLVYRAMQLAMSMSILPLYLFRAAEGKRSGILFAIFLVASIGQGFVTVTKFGILISVALLVGLWTAHRRRSIFGLDLRVLGWGVGSALLLFIAMVGIMIVRYDLDSWQQDWFFRKMLVYVCSSPSAWCIDIEAGRSLWTADDAGVSIRGPLELLGIGKRILGVYPKVVVDTGYYGSISNVYTGFRMLIADFGILGTAGISFFGGGVIASLENRYRSRPTVRSLCLQSIFLYLIYLMSVTLTTYYNVFYFLIVEAFILEKIFEVRSPTQGLPLPSLRSSS